MKRTVFLMIVVAACHGSGGDASPDAAGPADAPLHTGAYLAPGSILTTFAAGPVDCGGAMTTSFALTNEGTAPVTYSSTSTDPTFSLTPDHGTIAPGDTTTLVVEAAIDGATSPDGDVTGSITVTTNVTGLESQAIACSAAAQGAVLTVAPSPVAVGGVALNTPSDPTPFTLTNTGTGPVSIVVFPPDDSDYVLTFDEGIGTDVTLNPGDALTNPSVTFTPTMTGEIDTDAPIFVQTGAVCGTSATTIPFTGMGLATP